MNHHPLALAVAGSAILVVAVLPRAGRAEGADAAAAAPARESALLGARWLRLEAASPEQLLRTEVAPGSWLRLTLAARAIEIGTTITLSAVGHVYSASSGREVMAQACGEALGGCSPDSMAPGHSRSLASELVAGLAGASILTVLLCYLEWPRSSELRDLGLAPFRFGLRLKLRY